MNLFIGSSAKDCAYRKYGTSCKELITSLAELPQVNLVFGAYHKGLMKTCYDIFKQKGKKIIGVAPEVYKDDFKEVPCDEEVLTKNSMERLEKIYEKSDICLFLPGGIGTFSEFFACLEEMKSNPDNKQIILYNVDFFFSPMLEEMYQLFQQGFLDQNIAESILISNNKQEIINKIKESVENE